MYVYSEKKIEGLVLSLNLVHPFKTSFGLERERKFIVIRARKGEHEGWGEVVSSVAPLYSEETLSCAKYILRDYLFPLALKCNLEPQCFEEKAGKYRGNNMAKAGVSLSLWDLKGKIEGKPLWKIYQGKREEIPVGVSIGIQENLDALLKRVEKFWKEGYLRIKIKIAPGWDCNIVNAVRQAFHQIPLGADANSAYTEKDMDYLKCLDNADLLFLEQPLYPDDLYYHSILRKKLKCPIALDESIKNFRKMKVGYEMGAYSIVNIKVGRMGGIGQVLKAVELAAEKGIPLFCGGMLESGIGRAHNLHIASMSPFVLPGDISLTKRYYEKDITPHFEFSRPGYIKVPNGDGIGVEINGEFLAKITIEKF